MAPVSNDQGEPQARPAKRARISRTASPLSLIGNDVHDNTTNIEAPRVAEVSRSSNGHSYGSTTIGNSQMVILGDYIQYSSAQSQNNSSNKPNHDDGRILTKLLDSLPFDRMDFRVNNVRREQVSTCEWLFHHPHFKAWYESGDLGDHNGFIWLKGKPGCGKSTLMKAALEWALKQNSRRDSPDLLIPYFFNARGSASLEKSGLGLYRTLVHRILTSCPGLQLSFMRKFFYKDPGRSGEGWTTEELQGFLEDVVESGEELRLYLFIDALDEAEFEDDVRDLINFLLRLSDRALTPGSSCELRICLSSRHYPHITVGRGYSLVVERQPQHGRDIETYITKRLTCLEGPDKDDLRTEILNKSARVFLWVVLVVEILNKLDDNGHSLSEMRDHLDSIPANLAELFKEILSKSNHRIETSMLFFQWVLYSMRPLTPEEIFVAMEYSRSIHSTRWTPSVNIPIPDADRLVRYVVGCSRGLVEVTLSEPPRVQFIHETVREFLQGKNGLASLDSHLITNLDGISHETLRIACSRRLLTNDYSHEYKDYCAKHNIDNVSKALLRPVLYSKLPFLAYAVLHVFDHAEQAEGHGISQHTFLHSQLGCDGLWQTSSMLWWKFFQERSHYLDDTPTLLYFIAAAPEQQWLKLLGALLGILASLDININASGGPHGTALRAASHEGYTRVVQTLVDAGADANENPGQTDKTALQVASFHGYRDIVQILIDAGADINAQGIHYGSALQAASNRGFTGIVQMLVDRGVDINAKGCYGSSAIYVAVKENKANVVKLLIDAGADVNIGDRNNDPVLLTASSHGHAQIVQMLIDAGADVTAKGGFGYTAVQKAAIGGHEHIVRMLHYAERRQRGNAAQVGV